MVFEAERERREREAQRDLVLAWSIARLQRREHLPTLDRLLQRRQPAPTRAELARRAQEHAALMARMGGRGGGRKQVGRRAGADPGDAGRSG